LILLLTKAINKAVKPPFQFSEKEFDQLLDSDLINEENEDEQVILKGIANFGNISVKQIMRNRMDMVALSIDMNFEEVFQKIKDTRYSRIPIFEKNLDSIKGIIFIKDILIYRDQNNFDWRKLIRPGFFVPENKKIDDLLKEFRAKHTHIAIVVDEYGGTAGLVTLEDILEEIVGDISDEYDEADDELRYSKLDEFNYVFDGKTPINDLCKVLAIADDTFDDVRVEADTIGGLVLAIAGRFVFINEKVVFDNFTFTIESADRRRVKRVKMTINKSL
jgi:gliding motility-associated protein GldE